jgi:hypothetical protein
MRMRQSVSGVQREGKGDIAEMMTMIMKITMMTRSD